MATLLRFAQLAAICGIVITVRGAIDGHLRCKSLRKDGILDCCKFPTDLKLRTFNIKSGRVKTCLDYYLRDDESFSTERRKIETFECMEECIFNVTGWFNADMTLNVGVIIDDSQELFAAYPKWQRAARNSIRTCISRIDNSGLREGALCRSNALDFNACLRTQFYLNCPQKAWQGKRLECRKGKELIAKCHPLMFEEAL